MNIRTLALTLGLLIACQAPVQAFDLRGNFTAACNSAWQNVCQLVTHVKSKVSTKIAAVCAGSAAIAAGVYWYKQHLKEQKAIDAHALDLYLQNRRLSDQSVGAHVQQHWDFDTRLDFINKRINTCTPQWAQFLSFKRNTESILNNFFTPEDKKDQRYVSLKQQWDNLLDAWVQLGADTLAQSVRDTLADPSRTIIVTVGLFKSLNELTYSAQEYVFIANKVLDDPTWTAQDNASDVAYRVGRVIVDVLLSDASAEIRGPLEAKLLLCKPLAEIKDMVVAGTLALNDIVKSERFSLTFIKKVCEALLANKKATFEVRVQKAKNCWAASPERMQQVLDHLFTNEEKRTEELGNTVVWISNTHARTVAAMR